ncbi:MAG: DUF4276 family protein [Oscillatoria sp. SIO1A7]|nr:DUF4276 family protein [Oscillatoria sp. SIO1A7]
MKIAILVEGKTEKAFMPSLRRFLSSRLSEMPKIKPVIYNGRLPKKDKLKRVVENLLAGKDAYDAVIALTDVYTGTKDFEDATDAKQKMKDWVGDNPRFYPHAAQYDFEAWLLPFWPTIQKLAKKRDRSAPSSSPEQVNHNKPPSYHIKEIFELGKCRDSYIKPRDAKRILEENNLIDSAIVCLELKEFLNTILLLCGGQEIP